MVLDFVSQHFLHTGSSTAIQRFFVDMPTAPGNICAIRQVQVTMFELDRTRFAFDTRFAMSVDPDHVLASMILFDSTIFLSGSYENSVHTGVGFEILNSPRFFMYPEGIKCPYTRLPFFIQNSNTNADDTNWNVRVFYEYVKVSKQDLAIAVLRRGRARTRD